MVLLFDCIPSYSPYLLVPLLLIAVMLTYEEPLGNSDSFHVSVCGGCVCARGGVCLLTA